MPRLTLRGNDMFYVMAVSGDPNGELISRHATLEQAERVLVEVIETDAEDLLWYGIPDRDGVPTYAEAIEYSRDVFYIEEKQGNE